ncbi:AFL168Wp [Eremothecium gossypii ATCC 10895]|uniref:AFL168Wp n=1 Tax=Eremothecium gossypii (strain ATCC 10895 / CBS 109.51 / FGSC 9923 / NRRL Y-1056) TaxID=284811 RepID=Q755J1_EREGS|nr:AFL168Wp [Eremothecium gossypii ATCC 10895]AAS53206.1 AFL168Wp [Eremothecium gossypii ATCC 10895]AEY97516.1 FAFL168Wp [Eremothecium gossypii FDAG1]
MASLLKSYEADFQATLEQCQRLLRQAQGEPVAQRNATLQTLEQHKDDLYDILDQMEVEVNNMVGDPARQVASRSALRDLRREAGMVKQQLRELMDARDRDALFPAGAADMDNEQRQQLLSNHAMLQQTGERLVDAMRLANETEGIGNQVMMDLRSQRETLEHSRQNLFLADSYVDKSVRTLKTMSRRLVANKFISYAIIAVLILLILMVLYSKFK